MVHFKDLCVARCIHASKSGNCTSGGEIQCMVTYVPVEGGAGEMAVFHYH